MLDISIIIRSYNESRWLPTLLDAISKQDIGELSYELIVVDSGSTDATVDIARSGGCRILEIAKSSFSFGRSLNIGCSAANGTYLVFVSAHCIPIGSGWLRNLIEPLRNSSVNYVYGRQQGHEATKFSERQLFKKYYPLASKIPQHGYFCNNANAALPKEVWERYRFDEEITGLEDMYLAKRLTQEGMKIGYVAEASVYHIHEESWSKVRIRYERESIALQGVMPEVHLRFGDLLRYVLSSVFLDCAVAIEERCLFGNLRSIILFRMMQYWGSYRGNNEHRRVSAAMKRSYFYPR